MTKKAAVRAAALSGYCNTTQDIADETGVSLSQCSSYLHFFKRRGLVRITDRRLPNAAGKGKRLHVFEVVA